MDSFINVLMIIIITGVNRFELLKLSFEYPARRPVEVLLIQQAPRLFRDIKS
jgi:hypothetical protein